MFAFHNLSTSLLFCIIFAFGFARFLLLLFAKILIKRSQNIWEQSPPPPDTNANMAKTFMLPFFYTVAAAPASSYHFAWYTFSQFFSVFFCLPCTGSNFGVSSLKTSHRNADVPSQWLMEKFKVFLISKLRVIRILNTTLYTDDTRWTEVHAQPFVWRVSHEVLPPTRSCSLSIPVPISFGLFARFLFEQARAEQNFNKTIEKIVLKIKSVAHSLQPFHSTKAVEKNNGTIWNNKEIVRYLMLIVSISCDYWKWFRAIVFKWKQQIDRR